MAKVSGQLKLVDRKSGSLTKAVIWPKLVDIQRGSTAKVVKSLSWSQPIPVAKQSRLPAKAGRHPNLIDSKSCTKLKLDGQSRYAAKLVNGQSLLKVKASDDQSGAPNRVSV